MAGRNIKNNIETNIRINTKGAEKSSKKLYKDIADGQEKVSRGNKKVGGGKKGIAGLAASFKMLKASVLGAIPALGKLAMALISTGIGAIVVAIGALSALFISAAKKGAQFEKALSGLKAVAQATDEELSTLSDQAKKLGSTTAFTASQVVGLQTELAKLGFSIQEIRESTPAILDLAASLDVDLSEAASFAGATVNAFNLTTQETQRVVDVMAKSAITSAQDFSTLRESFGKAAPAANALGVSVEKTAALLGVLADSNIKGSEAGTALKNSFIELKKKGLSLEEGLAKIKGSSDKLLTAIELAGKRGGPALLVLAQKSEDLDGLTESLENAEGAAKAVAETRLDNLAGDTTKLASAWEGFLLQIEDGSGILNKISRGAVQFLTAAIGGLGKALNLIGFIAKEAFNGINNRIQGSAKIVKGIFASIGSAVTIFANEALLQLSRVPLLGRAIDKDAANKRIQDAKAILKGGLASIQEGVDDFKKQQLLDQTIGARFAADQAAKDEDLKQKAIQRKKSEYQEIQDEEDAKAEEEALKKEEKRLEKVDKLRQKFLKKQQDFDDITEEQKLERKRERALADLEELSTTTAEKRELEASINAYYDDLEKQREAEKLIEDQEQQLTLDEIELQRLRDLNEAKLEDELAFLESKRLLALSNEKLTQKEIDAINKKSENAKNKVRDTYVKAEEDGQAAVVDAALDGAAAAFGIAQEVGVAKMIMAAPEAISGSFKEAAKNYAPPMSLAMGALGAAGTVAPIIKGLSDIKKARFTKKSTGPAPGGNISANIGSSASAAGPTGINVDTISDIAANNSARLGLDTSLGDGASATAANNIMGGSQSHVLFSEDAYTDFQAQVSFKESKTSIGG